MLFEVLLALGILSFLVTFYLLGREIRAHIFLRRRASRGSYAPFASVIVPVRGLHDGLAQNIAALLRQKYKRYEVIFVLDSKRDPAYRVVKAAAGAGRARIAITKKRAGYYGKIAALVTGVDASRGEVLAFCDADSEPRRDWLASMAAPLRFSDVATGYRFYLPGGSFASRLRSAWNSIGLLFAWTRHSYIWGGSVALARAKFEAFRIREAWRNGMSDDSLMTAAVHAHGGKIFFSPRCILTASYATDGGRLKEFVVRQSAIVRHHFRKWWRVSLSFMLVLHAFIVIGIASLAAAIFYPVFLLPALLLLAHPIKELFMSRLRYRTFSAYGDMGGFTKYAAAELLASWLMLYSLLAASRVDTIRWRGRVYRIKDPHDIRVTSHGFE